MKPGFLVIDKSSGTRSTSCVNAVRRIFGKQVRVGHGGTLDSTAQGILVLLIGRATRTSSYVMALPKSYETTARFGLRTSTDDISGEIISNTSNGLPDDASMDRALLALTGLRDQIPPAVSAVKVFGERAHALARRGEVVNISPRPVYVRSITRTSSISENGELNFTIRCHKGTYVRSLVRDLGDMFSCGAAVASLERISIGPFVKEVSMPSDLLETSDRDFIEKRILPVSWISRGYSSYKVDPSMEQDLFSGKKIPMDRLVRLHWGDSTFGNIIVLVSRKCVSFGEISEKDGFSFFSPTTTIETGDVE